MPDIRTCKAYAKLLNEIEKAETDLKKLKKRKDESEEGVLKYLETHADKLTVEGRTLSIRMETWAKKKDNEATGDHLVRVLHAAGFSEYAPERVNWTSLSAFFRELAKEGESLPPELADDFLISSTPKVAQRKA